MNSYQKFGLKSGQGYDASVKSRSRQPFFVGRLISIFMGIVVVVYTAQLAANDAVHRVEAAPVAAAHYQYTQNQYSPSSSPQQYQAQGSWLLSKYDLNGDSRITEDEVVLKRLNIFRYLDANKDTSVSFSEYVLADKARRNNLLKARFSKIDGDGDGLVSESEYSSFLGLFSSIDLNADGVLNHAELNQSDSTGAPNDYCMLWFCFRTQLE